MQYLRFSRIFAARGLRYTPRSTLCLGMQNVGAETFSLIPHNSSVSQPLSLSVGGQKWVVVALLRGKEITLRLGAAEEKSSILFFFFNLLNFISFIKTD